MQGLLIGNLTGIPITQLNGAGTQDRIGGGNGDAFQLLLESMLLENLVGQLFSGNGGLLAGTDLGLFPEEGMEGKQNKGDDLLALMEMLQTPLLDQLRASQPQGASLVGLENQGLNEDPFGKMPIQSFLGEANGKMPIDLPEEQNLAPGEYRGLNSNNGGTAPEQFFSKGNPGPRGVNQPVETGVTSLVGLGEELGTPVKTITETEAEMMPGIDRGQVLPESEARPDLSSLSLMMDRNPTSAEATNISNQFTDFPKATGGIGYTELADQLIQSGKLKLLGTKQEMEIQLKPEYLGKLAIRLTLENGALTARFLVESHQVGRMLDNNVHQLKQTLEDQGIRFEQVQVEVGDPGSAFQEGQSRWEHSRFLSAKSTLGGIESHEVVADTQEYSSVGGIDYRA